MKTRRKPIHPDSRLQAVLLDAVEQAVVATDLRGHVIYWNAFAERLYGWSAAEVMDANLADLLVPEGLEAISREIMAQVRAGSSWSGEFSVKRRDGTIFPIHVTDSPIYDPDGALVGIVGVSFDISERRRADEDRERLAAIVTSTDDAILAWQLDGTVTSWNPGAERLFGYRSDEVLGRATWAIVPPEYIAEVQEVVGRLRGGERIERFETQRIRKDGQRIDISISASPLHNATGNVVGAAFIGHDITAQKRSERQLQESEQRFRSLFTQHPDAVFAMDLDGRYTDLNPTCEQLSGFSPDELLGRRYGDRSTAPEEARHALAIALGGMPLTLEQTLIARDDHPIPLHVTLVPIVINGSTVGVYGVARDITERKQTEEKLAMQARQQTAVADLGLLALTDIALAELLRTAVNVVSAVMEVEVAGVLEVVPEGHLLRLKVGVGFPETVVGRGTFSADRGSFLGRVLERCESVRMEALAADARSDDTLVDGLEMKTGLAIRVPGREDHNGVLLACTKRHRVFSDDEQIFLQAIATVLGAAIERQKAADDLRRREQEFKVLVEHAPDDIVRMDRELRFMYVNPAAERMFGISAGMLMAQTNRGLGIPEALVSSWARASHRVFRTGEDDELELIYPSADGDRYFHVRLSPEFGPDGAVNSVLGVGREITASKQREAEQARIYKELLERDSRLHELVERVLLNQQAAQPGRSRAPSTLVAEQFTQRERQILRLLARGLTNRQIGQQINLSPSTVKNYVASLLPRLNASDRTQAAVLATGLGLIDDEEATQS